MRYAYLLGFLAVQLSASDPIWTDINSRLQQAALRESKAYSEIQTRVQWEQFRDTRIAALKQSLGAWPETPKECRVVVTKTIDGDGFQIRNILYESRPGFWVTANLYVPKKPLDNMPGLLISHSHHNPKTEGELQDMGMTWARSGCAVLVPDLLGHGERRTHPFRTLADYPEKFRVSRQDYFFRYMTNLQLSALGDSLMGWMVWDLMRGIDVLLKQPKIDPDRIIMLGSVAGGGDPAGVTAALDPRITCVAPFNFGGWQPESTVLPNPDRDFAWFGDGYWESTRGLRGGANGGFAHWVIVGSIAPRRLISAHEFSWSADKDPAWARLQKVYAFYDAKDHLGFAHGVGSLKGNLPTDSHCNNIGSLHRKMIYPQLEKWFKMPIPTEYSKRLPSDELLCWTDEARKELQPKTFGEILAHIAIDRQKIARDKLAKLSIEDQFKSLRADWQKQIGNLQPESVKVTESMKKAGNQTRDIKLELPSGIPISVNYLEAAKKGDQPPLVMMLAIEGYESLYQERTGLIQQWHAEGISVALVELRGTGATRIGKSAERGSSRTSASQTEQILGGTILGNQLRDLNTVIAWLKKNENIDLNRIGIWAESMSEVNGLTERLVRPLEHSSPKIGEPGLMTVAMLAGLFESGIQAVHTRGGLDDHRTLFQSPTVWLPHDAIIPGVIALGDLDLIKKVLGNRFIPGGNTIDGLNRIAQKSTLSNEEAAREISKRLLAK